MYLQYLVVSLVVVLALPLQAMPDVNVNGLLSNKAILNIDGSLRILAINETSPEGIKLLQVGTDSVDIEYAGKRQTLSLGGGGQVRADFQAKKVKKVRLLADERGHFNVRLNINGRTVDALIDTGASSIAMNSEHARRLGIDTIDAPTGLSSTANGIVEHRRVTLNAVSVGDLRRQSVEAVVIEGDFPETVLVGNTFLMGFDIEVSSGVMVLKAKY